MKQVSMIFQGRNDDLEVFLERKMNQYSNDLEFENAAKIRDQIAGLKLLTESQKYRYQTHQLIEIFLALFLKITSLVFKFFK